MSALGMVHNRALDLKIHQLISTGIVHPPPSAIEWFGVKAVTSDDPEELTGGDLKTEMLTPIGSDKYIRARNFATIHRGGDQKLWLNWITDDATAAAYAIGQ